MFLLQEGNHPVLINPTGLAVLERNSGLQKKGFGNSHKIYHLYRTFAKRTGQACSLTWGTNSLKQACDGAPLSSSGPWEPLAISSQKLGTGEGMPGIPAAGPRCSLPFHPLQKININGIWWWNNYDSRIICNPWCLNPYSKCTEN